MDLVTPSTKQLDVVNSATRFVMFRCRWFQKREPVITEDISLILGSLPQEFESTATHDRRWNQQLLASSKLDFCLGPSPVGYVRCNGICGSVRTASCVVRVIANWRWHRSWEILTRGRFVLFARFQVGHKARNPFITFVHQLMFLFTTPLRGSGGNVKSFRSGFQHPVFNEVVVFIMKNL